MISLIYELIDSLLIGLPLRWSDLSPLMTAEAPPCHVVSKEDSPSRERAGDSSFEKQPEVRISLEQDFSAPFLKCFAKRLHLTDNKKYFLSALRFCIHPVLCCVWRISILLIISCKRTRLNSKVIVAIWRTSHVSGVHLSPFHLAREEKTSPFL